MSTATIRPLRRDDLAAAETLIADLCPPEMLPETPFLEGAGESWLISDDGEGSGLDLNG